MRCQNCGHYFEIALHYLGHIDHCVEFNGKVGLE